MNVATMKGLAAACLFLAAITGGLLPFILKQRSKTNADKARQAAAAASASSHPTAAHTDNGNERPRRKSVQGDEIIGIIQPAPYSPPSPQIGASPPPPQLPLNSQRSLQQPILGSTRASPSPKSSGYGSLSPIVAAGSPPLRSGSFRSRHPEVTERARRKHSLPGMDTGDLSLKSVVPEVAPVVVHVKKEPSESHAHEHSHHKHGRCHVHMDVDRFLSLGNMLGAGIFLGGGLLHLLAESMANLSDVQSTWSGSLAPIKDFPVGAFLCGVGFFTILCVEEATIAITTRSKEKKESKLKEEKEKQKAAAATVSQSKRVAVPKRRAGAPVASPTQSVSPGSPRTHVRLHGASTRYDEMSLTGRSSLPIDRSDSPFGDPMKRDLARNILQGLTPRIMLLPPMPIRRNRAQRRRKRQRAREEATEIVVHDPSSPVGGPAQSRSSSSSSSSSDFDGPIQRFLDAAYHSPSPFPSIADPLMARRLNRYQAEGRGRRGSFPPDDSDSNMLPAGILSLSRGTSAESASDFEPSQSQRSPGPIYSASSRALGGAAQSNGHVTRKRSEEQPVAVNASSSLAVSVGSTAPFSVHPSVIPSAVVGMRQPLLSKASSLGADPSASPPSAFPTSAQLQALHEEALRRESGLPAADTLSESSFPSADLPRSSSDRPRQRTPPQSEAQQKLLLHDDDHSHSHIASSSHGHGHGHGDADGHSHISLGQDTSYIVAYLLVLALSFHSIFEGIALGTQSDMSSTISIFIAILAHTPLAGFALGVSLVKARTSANMSVSCLFLFSVMSPAGALLGLALSAFLEGDALTTVSACFQSFSAGTFLFVALEEIIPKELAQAKDKTIKLVLCVFGFMMMAAIKLFDTD